MWEWCEANGLRMRGHCIFWGRPKYVPQWQKDASDADLYPLILARAARVTRRWRGRIGEWDLDNELLDENMYRTRFGPWITQEMGAAARRGNPAVTLYTNDYAILAGYKDKPERYAAQIRELLAQGVPIGGIGVQGHFVGNRPDPATVKRSLDLLAEFGLPIRITEYDCTEDPDGTALETVYRIGFAHPSVTGILMWGFWEGRHWKPKAALWSRDWTPTPRARMYEKLVQEEWHTKASGRTGADGRWGFHGFHGTYGVRVRAPDGRTAETEGVLAPKGVNRMVVRLVPAPTAEAEPGKG
jgi:GH35 family endo-1,4-beta-xylanase